MRKIKNTLCLLLAMSMFTVLFACATKNEFGILEKTDNNMVKFCGWGNMIAISYTRVNGIAMTGEEGSESRCSINSGETKEAGTFLFNHRYDVTSATVESGTIIYWCFQYHDEVEVHNSEKEVVWLEFINQKDSHILGYAVVKVNRISQSYYEPEVVKAVTFPKVNDEYQTVTEEQVNLLINNAEK